MRRRDPPVREVRWLNLSPRTDKSNLAATGVVRYAITRKSGGRRRAGPRYSAPSPDTSCSGLRPAVRRDDRLPDKCEAVRVVSSRLADGSAGHPGPVVTTVSRGVDVDRGGERSQVRLIVANHERTGSERIVT